MTSERLAAAKQLNAKLTAFMNSIETSPMPDLPDLPDKPGTKWVLDYTFGDSVFQWKAVEDVNAEGTSKNPIVWESGMEVKANYWYTHENKKYVCVMPGNPTDLSNKYFEQW